MAPNEEGLKRRYLGVIIDTALVMARQSQLRVTGWRAVGSLSPRGQRGSPVRSGLTAKLANYEQTDKISVARRCCQSGAVAWRGHGGGSRAIYETSKIFHKSLSISTN